MPSGPSQAEQTFDADLASNTPYTFTGNIQETQTPPTVTGAETLDGANFTLTGDGTSPALVVSTTGTLTLESLSVANTASAAAIQDNGAVIFGSDGTGTPTSIGDISAAITGSGTVTINAAGAGQNGAPVVFGAANTYTGATTISAGAALQLDANGSINDSGAVADAGVLDISGAQTATGAATTLTVNNLSGAGTVNLGENYILLEGVSTDLTGVIENNGNAGTPNDATGNTPTGSNGGQAGGVQIGAVGDTVEAHAILDGAETYVGSTRVFGTLTLGAAGSLEDSSNLSLKANGAAVNIESNTFINELTGVAGSTISTGTTTGFTLTVTENVVAASYSGVISGEGGITIDGVANAVAAAAGSATATPTFELTLDGVNTYTGATLIENGASLGVGAGGTLGTGQLQFDNGTLDISASTGGAGSPGTVAVAGIADDGGTNAINLGANNLIVTNADSGFGSATSNFTGVISGTGSLEIGTAAIADATLTLSGANTYTASTVIYGTLNVEGNDAGTASIADSSNVSLKTSTAVLDVSVADQTGTFIYSADGGASGDVGVGVAINTLTGVAGSTVFIGNNTLLINETTNATFSGVISDTGGVSGTTAGDGEGPDNGVSLVVRGPATLTLGGDNTYVGETLVKGSLALGAGGSIADSSNVYVNGSFNVAGASGPVNIESLAGDNASAKVVLGSNTLDITSDNSGGIDPQSFAFAGVISGAGGLSVGNVGTTGNGEPFDYDAFLALDNVNTYTGATTIYGDGALELDQGGSIATKAITDDGTLALFESAFTLSAVVSGTGSLVVGESGNDATGFTANGQVTITAADTYTGITLVEGDGPGASATLAIGAGGSIVNSAVTLLENATLDISAAGGNVSIQGLSGYNFDDGTPSVVLGANTLIITANNAASTPGGIFAGSNFFEGVISGTGGLQIDTAASLALDGIQTYTGATAIYGTLLLEGNTSLASGSVSLLASNGTFGALDVSEAAPINASGAAIPVAINNLSGDVDTNVYLGGNTLQVTETTAATFGGIISDGTSADPVTGAGAGATVGSLTVNGTAILTLTGAETYTGDTTVNGDLTIGIAAGSSTVGSIADSASLIDDGIFSIGGSTTVSDLAGTGTVKMSTFTLTDTTNTTDVFSGIIHGAGLLDVEGTGTLVLTGSASDYSGGTELGVGGGAVTLEVAALHAAGSGAITFGNAGALLEITNAALTGGNTASESFANVIHIAANGGTIDLTDLTFETANSETSNTFAVGAGGVLVVTEGNVSVTLHTDLAAGTVITPISDTHGGTEFTFAHAVAQLAHG